MLTLFQANSWKLLLNLLTRPKRTLTLFQANSRKLPQLAAANGTKSYQGVGSILQTSSCLRSSVNAIILVSLLRVFIIPEVTQSHGIVWGTPTQNASTPQQKTHDAKKKKKKKTPKRARLRNAVERGRGMAQSGIWRPARCCCNFWVTKGS